MEFLCVQLNYTIRQQKPLSKHVHMLIIKAKRQKTLVALLLIGTFAEYRSISNTISAQIKSIFLKGYAFILKQMYILYLLSKIMYYKYKKRTVIIRQ